MARPKEVWMSENQLGRHDAFGQQALWPVEVGQQRIQNSRSLPKAALEGHPLTGGQNEWNWIECPGAIRALGIGIYVVRDAVFYDQAPRKLEPSPGDRPCIVT